MLLTEEQVAEIRAGVREESAGPWCSNGSSSS